MKTIKDTCPVCGILLNKENMARGDDGCFWKDIGDRHYCWDCYEFEYGVDEAEEGAQ